MLSDEQKDELKKLGEKFYRDIDMEKYRPVPSEEAVPLEELIGTEYREKIQIEHIKRALQSGLSEEDLSSEERSLLNRLRTV